MVEHVLREAKYAEIGDGLRVHYHEAGKSSDPAVVFVHGSGPGASGYSNFKHNFHHFAQQGFRALVPDSLGFGYSSKPESAEYTLGFLTGGLRRFLDAMGVERCSVVGNSLGGAMAIKLALDHPELVDKLVLMAPGGLEEREVYVKMEGIGLMMRSIFAAGPTGLTREAMQRVFSLQLYDAHKLEEETLDERLAITRTQPVQVWKTLQVPNLTPKLAELRQPVLTFWGMNDKFCPVSGAMRIMEAVPQARATLLGKCGHWVMVEYPELFNRQCVEFLREGSRELPAGDGRANSHGGNSGSVS